MANALPDKLLPGAPYPLGANWEGLGVNFAVFSSNAHRIEVCLFDSTGRKELMDSANVSVGVSVPSRSTTRGRFFIESKRVGHTRRLSPGPQVRGPIAGTYASLLYVFIPLVIRGNALVLWLVCLFDARRC